MRAVISSSSSGRTAQHGGGQAVPVLRGQGQAVVEAGDDLHRRDRAEGLLPHQVAARRHVGDHGRWVVRARSFGDLAARAAGATVLEGDIDILSIAPA